MIRNKPILILDVVFVTGINFLTKNERGEQNEEADFIVDSWDDVG